MCHKEETEKLLRAILTARAAAEEGRGRLLAASACLDILQIAFRHDGCKELLEVMLGYARSKVMEV